MKTQVDRLGTEEQTAVEFSLDPVIEAYKKDIDITLIRENLKLTVEQRLLNLMDLQRFAEEIQRAGKRMTGPR